MSCPCPRQRRDGSRFFGRETRSGRSIAISSRELVSSANVPREGERGCLPDLDNPQSDFGARRVACREFRLQTYMLHPRDRYLNPRRRVHLRRCMDLAGARGSNGEWDTSSRLATRESRLNGVREYFTGGILTKRAQCDLSSRCSLVRGRLADETPYRTIKALHSLFA